MSSDRDGDKSEVLLCALHKRRVSGSTTLITAHCTHTQINAKDVMSSQAAFEESLGFAGKELLSAGLTSALKDVGALASMSRAAVGME